MEAIRLFVARVEKLDRCLVINPALRRCRVVVERHVASSGLPLKGITIGDNTVVAAVAFVVSDLPADTVCAGNPARPVKQLDLD